MTDVAKEFPSYLAECREERRTAGHRQRSDSVQRAGKSGEFIERVAGRVRKQAFVIGVSSSVEEDPAMTKDMRREKANVVAEHVAGILF